MREKSSVEIYTPTERPKGENLRKLSQLWWFISPYRSQMILAFMALTLVAVTVLALGAGLKALIDRGLVTQDQHALNVILLILLGLVGLMALASYGRSYLVSWIGERAITDLRQAVFNHLLSLDMSFFEQIRGGEIVTRLTTDTTLVQIVVGTSAAIGLRNLFLLVGGMGMMFATSWKLSLYTLAIVPFVLIPIIFYGRRVRAFSRVAQDHIADVGGFLEETIHNIRIVQAFEHEDVDYLNFHRYSEKAFAASIKRTRARSLLACAVMVLVFGGVSLVLWIGGQNVLAGKMTAGELSAFIFYAVVVAGSAGSISEIIGDLQRAAGACERLLEILETLPAIHSPPSTHTRPLPISPRGIIAMHNVTFTYPSFEQPALCNLTLSVAPGEKLAIVGPSGAGKSTIFQLLMRFYDPQMGRIFFDGVDLQDLALPELRSRLGIVPQDAVVFSGTLYDNILYGRPDANSKEVIQAAEAAYLHDVIEQLPQGFKTRLGTKGITLSGGQKQRLAIARAILRNPPVLLLDEATNALDAQSEQAVQQSLKHLMATRTTIVIAHRLATVLKADRIVVLNKGQIDAVGTHAELISREGLYRKLATLQFADAIELSKYRQVG